MNQFMLHLAQQFIQKLDLNHIVWRMVIPLFIAFILTLFIIYFIVKTTQPNHANIAESANKATINLILRLDSNEWRNELLFMAGVDVVRFETVKSQSWDFNDEEYFRLRSILQKYDDGLISESYLMKVHMR